MEKRILFFGIIFFSILNFSFSQTKKELKFIEAYKNSAFQIVNNEPSPLMKWNNDQTINYLIEGEFKYFSKKNWDKFLAELESITPLRFNNVNNKDSAQVVIHFKPLFEFFDEIEYKYKDYVNPKFISWSTKNYSKEYILKSASFCIDSERVKSIKHGNFLIKRLWLKSIGLLGEAKDENSLLYKKWTPSNHRFTLNDKRIVKMHYLEKIKSGMKKENILDVLETQVDLEAFLKEKIK